MNFILKYVQTFMAVAVVVVGFLINTGMVRQQWSDVDKRITEMEAHGTPSAKALAFRVEASEKHIAELRADQRLTEREITGIQVQLSAINTKLDIIAKLIEKQIRP